MALFDIETICALVTKHAQDCEFSHEYGEPGYTVSNPARGILFANWNNVPQHIQNSLENRGFDMEWSDEWLTESQTGLAYRTQPDSHGWKPSYVLSEDCEIVGADTIRNDESELDWYLTEHLANDCERADTFDIDLSNYGFTMVSEDESGLHIGQNGNPAVMLKAAQSIDSEALYVFQINATGQFDIRFSLWRRDPENEFHSSEIEDATRGYLECALWTGTDESDSSGGAPLDANYSMDEISEESKARARAIVRDFMIDNETLYNEALSDSYDAARFGHDLWLTRNGHGAGYWDRNELEALTITRADGITIGDALSEAARELGESYATLISIENGYIEVQ